MLVAIATVALLGSGQSTPATPELILRNGHIVTVDASFSIAEAVAVAGGRFVAVGQIERHRTNGGTFDACRRSCRSDRGARPDGQPPAQCRRWTRGRSVASAHDRRRAERGRARVATTEAGGIVLSNSDWHEAQLNEQRLPLRDDLDKVAPSRPVILVRGGHEYIVNSAALARWKIDEHTAEPAGGRISKYPDGRLNGELVDTAKALVALPRPAARTLDQRITDKVAEYRTLNAAGLTTVRHPGISIDEYRLLQEMQKRGVLTMRIQALLRPGGDADAIARALKEANVHQGEGDDWLRIGGIKLAVDGGFEGGLMRQPYEKPYDEGGSFRGLQTVEREPFIKTVRALNQHGWRIGTHAVGDAAMDLVLDAYEAADRDKSIAGQRWSIEHAFIGRADHLPRLKKLEIAISAQDHLYLAGPSLVKYWGRERAVPHHARADVSRQRPARFVGHRRPGRPIPAVLDDVPLRHARHAQRRRDGHRTAHQPRRRARAGDDQQCPADVRRGAQGID